MDRQEVDDRFAAMTARVGALEMLVEALLAERIRTSPHFRKLLDDDFSIDDINVALPTISDEGMRERVQMIGSTLSDRLAGARRQALRPARTDGRG